MAMTMVMIMLSGEHCKTSVWGADQDNLKQITALVSCYCRLIYTNTSTSAHAVSTHERALIVV
jgi:hypothetical protein